LKLTTHRKTLLTRTNFEQPAGGRSLHFIRHWRHLWWNSGRCHQRFDWNERSDLRWFIHLDHSDGNLIS